MSTIPASEVAIPAGTLHDRLDALAGALSHALDAPVTAIYLFDVQNDELVVAATRGLPRSSVGFVRVAPGEGVAGTAALERRAVIENHPAAAEPFIPGFDNDAYGSRLAVPIERDGALVGVLALYKRPADGFSGADVEEAARQADLCAALVTEESHHDLGLRWPSLLSMLKGFVGASYGPLRVAEEVVVELGIALDGVRCAIVLLLDDGPRLVDGDELADLGNTLLAFARTRREDGFETTRTLILPLRGATGVCGYLGIRHDDTAATGWQTAPARVYVENVASHLGNAIDRMMRRTGSAERTAMSERHLRPGGSPYADFVTYVVENRGLSALLTHGRDVLGTPVGVVDAYGELLGGTIPESSAADIAIATSEGTVGRLLAGRSVRDEPALEVLAHVVTLELAKQRHTFEIENRLRNDVLAMLMRADAADHRTAYERAATIGVSLGEAYRPVAMQWDAHERSEDLAGMLTSVAHRHLGTAPRVPSFAKDGSLLLLVPAEVTDVMERVTRLDEYLRTQAHVPRIGIGVGRARIWPDRFASEVRRGMLSADLSRRLDVDGPLDTGRIGIYGLLLQLDESAWQEYVDDVLGPLREQDRRHGTVLVRTLDAYHRNGELHKPTADELFIHTNTLKHRLARIDALTGDRLKSPQKRVELFTALYVLRLMDGGFDGSAR